MPESNTTTDPRVNVNVPSPDTGADISVASEAGGNLVFGFDPSTATATRPEGSNDLVFDVDGGGKVTISGFFEVGDNSLPSLTLPDGTEVAAADFFQGSELDMTTAAGPGAGTAASGGTNYDDDGGALLAGVDKYGMLGTDFWGRATEVSEEFQGLGDLFDPTISLTPLIPGTPGFPGFPGYPEYPGVPGDPGTPETPGTITTPGGPASYYVDATGLNLEVDESYMPGGTNNLDGETPSKPIGFVITGNDGLATVTVNGVDYAVVDGVLQGFGTVQGNNGSLSNGQVVDNGDGTYLLIFDYTQGRPETHSEQGKDLADNADSFEISVGSNNGATSSTITTNVDIIDDIPEAYDDLRSMLETQTSIDGSVLPNDVSGYDGWAEQPVTTPGTYQGQYGTLELNGDGTYTYTLTSGVPDAGATETFPYTVMDGDGDTADANLIITLVNVPPTANDPGGTALTVEVHDVHAVGAATDTHDETVDLFDGPEAFVGMVFASDANISVGGSELPIVWNLVSDTQWQGTVNGELMLTVDLAGWDADGNVTIEVTQTDPMRHASGSGVITVSGITVEATDEGGSSVRGGITVTVIDDVPVANADYNTVTQGTFSTSGNVVFGGSAGDAPDFSGADGWAANPVTNPGTHAGRYGYLELDANGNYTYTLTATVVPANAVESFNYQVVDSDGDTASSTLTITLPELAPPNPAGDSVTLALQDVDAVGTLQDSDVKTLEFTKGTQDFVDAEFVETAIPQVTGHGEDFNWELVDNVWTGTGANGTVITVTLGDISADGNVSVTATLNDPATHGVGSDEIRVEGIEVLATDSRGSSAKADVVVTVADDTPLAVNDFRSIDEGYRGVGSDSGSVYSIDGNVLTPNAEQIAAGDRLDAPGADGWAENPVSLLTSENGDVIADGSLKGKYGKLELQPNGEYTYTLDGSSVPDGGGEEVFYYQAVDKDGDITTAKLTITVNNTGPEPLTDLVEILVKDEDVGTAAATQVGTPLELFYGPEAIETVVFTDKTFTQPSVANLASDAALTWELSADGKTWTASDGDKDVLTVTITGFEADGEVTVAATLLVPMPHAGDEDEIEITNLQILGTDTGGSSLVAGVKVTVVDDIPTAYSDEVALANTQNVVSGNVLTSEYSIDKISQEPLSTTDSEGKTDTYGADGPGSLDFKEGSIYYTADGGTTTTELTLKADGTLVDAKTGLVNYGILTLDDATGDYTYDRGTSAFSGDIVVPYTITDSDGDVSDLVDLTISVTEQITIKGGVGYAYVSETDIKPDPDSVDRVNAGTDADRQKDDLTEIGQKLGDHASEDKINEAHYEGTMKVDFGAHGIGGFAWSTTDVPSNLVGMVDEKYQEIKWKHGTKEIEGEEGLETVTDTTVLIGYVEGLGGAGEFTVLEVKATDITQTSIKYTVDLYAAVEHDTPEYLYRDHDYNRDLATEPKESVEPSDIPKDATDLEFSFTMTDGKDNPANGSLILNIQDDILSVPASEGTVTWVETGVDLDLFFGYGETINMHSNTSLGTLEQLGKDNGFTISAGIVKISNGNYELQADTDLNPVLAPHANGMGVSSGLHELMDQNSSPSGRTPQINYAKDSATEGRAEAIVIDLEGLAVGMRLDVRNLQIDSNEPGDINECGIALLYKSVKDEAGNIIDYQYVGEIPLVASDTTNTGSSHAFDKITGGFDRVVIMPTDSGMPANSGSGYPDNSDFFLHSVKFDTIDEGAVAYYEGNASGLATASGADGIASLWFTKDQTVEIDGKEVECLVGDDGVSLVGYYADDKDHETPLFRAYLTPETGEWIYVQYAEFDNETLIFSIGATDNDGDFAPSSIIVTIPELPPQVPTVFLKMDDTELHEAAIKDSDGHLIGTGMDWSGNFDPKDPDPLEGENLDTATGTFSVGGDNYDPDTLVLNINGQEITLLSSKFVDGVLTETTQDGVFKVTVEDLGGGNYQFECQMLKAIPHPAKEGEEDSKEFENWTVEKADLDVSVSVKGTDGESYESETKSITVYDDNVITEAILDITINEPIQDYCLTLMVDTSNSMRDRTVTVDGVVKTYLEVTKEAIVNMLEDYQDKNPYGKFAITMIKWSGSARTPVTYDNIQDAIDNIATDIGGVSSYTNYNAALQAGYTAITRYYNNSAYSDYSHKAYFFSDGEPFGAQGDKYSSSNAVPAGTDVRPDDWVKLVNGQIPGISKEAVDIYSVGIGLDDTITSGSFYTHLNRVLLGGDDGDKFMPIKDPANLSSELATTVSEARGNIFDGELFSISGADKDYVITGISIGDKDFVTTQQEFELNGVSVTLSDDGKMSLKIWPDGTYQVIAEPGVTSGTCKGITFQLKDADGDISTITTDDIKVVGAAAQMAMGAEERAAVSLVMENEVNASNVPSGYTGSNTAADTITGNDSDNRINGRGGADNLRGEGGDDHIWGGSGADTIDGGTGHDKLYGQDGNDLILGGAGNDTIFGGAGEDVIYGGADNDWISGGADKDTIYGDEGNDTLFGDGGNDILNGGAGDDIIFGGTGNDTMTGGDGADIFAWKSADMGGKDVITDFTLKVDSLSFEDLLDARANDLTDMLKTKQITLEHEDDGKLILSLQGEGFGGAQTVEITLAEGSHLDQAQINIIDGEDLAAKAAFLQVLMGNG